MLTSQTVNLLHLRVTAECKYLPPLVVVKIKWKACLHSGKLGAWHMVSDQKMFTVWGQNVGYHGQGELRTAFAENPTPRPPTPSWDSRTVPEYQSMMGKCHLPFVLFNKLMLWSKFWVNACNFHSLAFITLSIVLTFHEHQSALAHAGSPCTYIHIKKALVVNCHWQYLLPVTNFSATVIKLAWKEACLEHLMLFSSEIYDQSQGSESLFVCTLHATGGPARAC